MRIPPVYKLSSDILQLLAKIDANREVIFSQKPSASLVDKIQRSSVLKSSLFSAKIEGNRLNIDEISLTDEEQEQIEIQNILRAIQYISVNFKVGGRMTKTKLLKLHRITMHGLRYDAGKFRKEVSAIFNQAGIAVYMTPPPAQVSDYVDKLSYFINTKKEEFILVKAFIAHLIFEKIHPFVDGNGRVGRLLIYAILQLKGYNFGIHVPFEEYLDKYRDAYYYHLDTGLKETEAYLEFMLNAFYEQTNQLKATFIKQMSDDGEDVFLPPRQEEIKNIIKEHKMVSFDFLRRRFIKIPERTIRYDLKKLSDANIIVKIGKTKGALYKVR